MQRIKPIQTQPKPIKVRQPTEAERRLKLALRVAHMHHTYSMAQMLGIYPA